MFRSLSISFLFVSLLGAGSSCETTAPEEFGDFFLRFKEDRHFQMERIKFPLAESYNELDDNTGEYANMDNTIEERDWRFEDFGYETEYGQRESDAFRPVISGEGDRINFAWQGINNGINIRYEFERIDGKWFLVKLVDDSM